MKMVYIQSDIRGDDVDNADRGINEGMGGSYSGDKEKVVTRWSGDVTTSPLLVTPGASTASCPSAGQSSEV